MKIGFIGTEVRMKMVEQITREYFPEIETVFHVEDGIYYNEKIAETLAHLKGQIDAFIFGGELQYKLYSHIFSPDVLCYHIKKDSSSLLNSFLSLSAQGIDITRISIDNYSPSTLDRILGDIGLKQHNIRLLKQKAYSKQYYQQLIAEHKSLYDNKEVNACITTLSFIYEWLQKEGIPAAYSRPTTDNIVKTIERAKEEYLLTASSDYHDLAVIRIRILPKKDYSYISQDEYLMNHERLKAEEELYCFAKARRACVVSRAENQYTIFINHKDLEEYTNDFECFPLISAIHNNSNCCAKAGIGFGFNPSESFSHATLALEKADSLEKSCTYIVHNPASISGPLFFSEVNSQVSASNLKRFAELSRATGISETKLCGIYALIEKTRKNQFTADELARYLKISVRTASRLIAALEANHLANFLSFEATGNAGRPKNIYEIHLTDSENL